jgi:hypothetical protein
MTTKRDLKRRVRDRQERTGESYVTARRHVTANAPPTPESVVPVVELVDLSSQAAAAGLRCRVHMFPALAARVDPIAAITRLRDVLTATDGDPATDLFRAVVLRGEPAQVHLTGRAAVAALEEGRRFLARALAGLGGVSERGRMMAFEVGGQMMVCLLWITLAVAAREPAVILTTAESPISDTQPWRWR